jgi:hypothetical protein
MSIGGVVKEILYIADDDMFPVPFHAQERSPDYAEVHIQQERDVLVQRVRNPEDILDMLLGKTVWGGAQDVMCSIGGKDVRIASRLTTRDWQVDYRAMYDLFEQYELKRKKEQGYVGLSKNSLRTRRIMELDD